RLRRSGGGRGERDHGPPARLEPAAAGRRDAAVPRAGRGRARAGRHGRWFRAPPGPRRGGMDPPRPARGPRRLLTFRLDQEQRQRLRARLAREGRTMSEVVTHGLRQYVQHARHRDGLPGVGAVARVAPVLPERVAARLRELRSSGRSELLSAALAALTEAGWPLRSLAEALGISRQAVQARVRRLTPAALRDAAVRDAAV